ncbi:MAG TPA: hypothetical protein ENF94_00680, partial [Candidatus Woesearchaeota archaeon]|nr:hypothetical protein [Candidatus Woesearchaeota archaeon]
MDSLSPVIKEFTITPKATRGPVNLAYLVEDYGMHPDNTEQCSGIQEVKFTINGNPILSDRELTKGKCTKTKGVNYVYSGTEPIARVCAQAIDNVGLESEEVCEDFTRDEGPPEIKDIQLVDYNGLVLTHVKTDSPVDVKVRATVTDESGIESVNASIPLTGQTNYIPYTNKEGNNYYWTTSGGSKFTITQGSNGTIRVKATDKVGNSAQENFDYNIKLDTVPPTELSESSAATDDEGRPLLTYDSYLVLTFSDKDDSGDPGIGMRQRKAFLDLSELKMGSKVQADSCRNIMNDKWECKWRIQPPDLGQDVEPGVHNIVLLRSTQDDLGNKITDEERIEATYQQQGPIKPTVIEYNVIPGPEGVGGEAVRGDTVQFKVRAMNFESAEADFSEIEGESSKAPEECVYDNITDSQICTFEEVVGISGPAEVTINFTFTDAFGDSSTTEKTIDIYEIEGESTPNYWRSSVECSPHPIDRKTTSQIPQHVVCKVNLRTSHSNLETVNIVGPTSIYECMGNVSGFIDNIRTINTAPGSREPYLMIDLPARDYYLDNLMFKCPLSIYSKEERKKIIHSAPEEELVNIKLEFYDQPLGEIYEKRDKESNRAIDDARSLHGGIIKELEDFMKGAEDVCQWKNIITGAIAAGMGLVATLGGLQDTLPFLRSIKLVREPICHSVEKVDETWVTDVFNVVDSFCAIINCQASGGKKQWNLERWTGGAAPWCMDIEKGLKDTELGAAVRYSQGTIKTSESDNTMKFWATNMKDNIYQSFACLCIPGILRNLNKIAQIDCKYATCLYKDYKETGETMSYCKNMDHYLKCTY